MFTRITIAFVLGLFLLGTSCDNKNPVSNVPVLPNTPSSITATAGDGSISVTWSTVTGATSYYVYYVAGATVNKTTGNRISAGASPYTITPLTNGTQYAVAVSATNADGESNLSTIRTATPVSEYSIFWGIWKASMLVGTAPGKFNLILNNDFTFSFSQVMDSTGIISRQASGTYQKTNANTIRLSSLTSGDGYYKYTITTSYLTLLWVSGYDFMNASTPATTTWSFYKQ